MITQGHNHAEMLLSIMIITFSRFFKIIKFTSGGFLELSRLDFPTRFSKSLTVFSSICLGVIAGSSESDFDISSF